jgi:hypothetical protein
MSDKPKLHSLRFTCGESIYDSHLFLDGKEISRSAKGLRFDLVGGGLIPCVTLELYTENLEVELKRLVDASDFDPDCLLEVLQALDRAFEDERAKGVSEVNARLLRGIQQAREFAEALGVKTKGQP